MIKLGTDGVPRIDGEKPLKVKPPELVFTLSEVTKVIEGVRVQTAEAEKRSRLTWREAAAARAALKTVEATLMALKL